MQVTLKAPHNLANSVAPSKKIRRCKRGYQSP